MGEAGARNREAAASALAPTVTHFSLTRRIRRKGGNDERDEGDGNDDNEDSKE